jgi:hypothetical protein
MFCARASFSWLTMCRIRPVAVRVVNSLIIACDSYFARKKFSLKR